jgi:hypothetical protein
MVKYKPIVLKTKIKPIGRCLYHDLILIDNHNEEIEWRIEAEKSKGYGEYAMSEIYHKNKEVTEGSKNTLRTKPH